MQCRPYQPPDFPALYAIEEICFQPPERFTRAYMRQLTRKRNAATWIAERDSQMLGFAIADWPSGAAGRLAYIQTLEVLPQARGQGIGNELLAHLEVSASQAEARAIWLHVDAENSPAIRLYTMRGYQLRGREEDYYGQNRPALVFVKLLNPTLRP